MSNDINASRPPQATAPLPPGLKVEAEKVQRLNVVETSKTAVEKKYDPQEARRTLQEVIEDLNKQMQSKSRDLSFSVDDVANKVVVTVKNQEGEVIRQIPSEVALRLAHNLEKMKGLMQDKKT